MRGCEGARTPCTRTSHRRTSHRRTRCDTIISSRTGRDARVRRESQPHPAGCRRWAPAGRRAQLNDRARRSRRAGEAARASRSYPPSTAATSRPSQHSVCHRRDSRREPHKLSRRQAHPAEWIVPMRIEAHRQQDQLRSELQEHVLNRLVDPLVVGIGRASLQRKIDGETDASSRSGLIGRPGAGVVRVLMR